MQNTVKWKTYLCARRTKFVPIEGYKIIRNGLGNQLGEGDSPRRVRLDILLMVQILFAISVTCLLVLVGAAFAIVRHVCFSHQNNRTPAPPEPSFGQHFNAESQYDSVSTPRLVPHQTLQAITAKKGWNKPSQVVEIHPASPESNPTLGARKAPQPARPVSASSERVDWAHFNKDFGDLTDPYTSRPHKISGARTAASKRF